MSAVNQKGENKCFSSGINSELAARGNVIHTFTQHHTDVSRQLSIKTLGAALDFALAL